MGSLKATGPCSCCSWRHCAGELVSAGGMAEMNVVIRGNRLTRRRDVRLSCVVVVVVLRG